jgi:hypothetical protein
LSSSNSSSSKSSDSEYDRGHRDNYMLENHKKNSLDKKYVTKEYHSLDKLRNDACLLSDLQKPPQK